jgi:uncharacterized protein (UPF0264 family)
MDDSKPTSPEREADLTQLLVSVRNAVEAETVSRYPIAILDVKEPDRGPLGSPDPETLRQITKVVAEDQTLSFAAGELSQWRQPDKERTENGIQHHYGGLLHKFRFIKIGLAGMRFEENWRCDWQVMFGGLPGTTSAVVVSYFDYETCGAPSPRELIEFAAAGPNCFTILFDTYDKTNDLFGYITSAELAALVNESRSNGLQTVVAGSVSESSLANVAAVKPDFIGVRGAVCRGNRGDQIDGRLVNELASSLQAVTEN